MKKTTRPIFTNPAPPMTTSRLLIRPMQPSDLADFHALRSQLEVMQWTSTGHVDADLEATQVWLNRFLPPNDATTFNFAVEELAVPGQVVGALGCHIVDPPECGFMLRSEVWGRGYATEAFQRWLKAWWELPRRDVLVEDDDDDTNSSVGDPAAAVSVMPEVLRATVVSHNVASGRILARCGFQPVKEEMIEEHGATVKLITLELPRPG